MAVRHTPPSGPSVVHKGQKGGTTGCGVDSAGSKSSLWWVARSLGIPVGDIVLYSLKI